MKYDIIVVGCGVAGSFFLKDISSNFNVLAIEKNDSILRKFMLTGSGDHANIMNIRKVKDIVNEDVFSNVPKFSYGLLEKFGADHMKQFLKKERIDIEESKRGKMFIKCSNKKFLDLIAKKVMNKENVAINFSETVLVINKLDDNSYEVVTNRNKYYTERLVISTGGKSYPGTGSSGDGFNFLKKMNLNVDKLFPIGNSLSTKDSFKEIAGTSLQDVRLSVSKNNKVIKQETSDFIFTHFGIGGPVTRRISHYFFETNNNLHVAFISEKKFDEIFSQIHHLNELSKHLSKKFLKFIFEKENIDYYLDTKNLKKSDFEKIKNVLTNYEIKISSVFQPNFSIATGGGLSLKEINPSNLMTKNHNNLFVLGECLAINVLTGGYNIMTAYATAMACSNYLNQQN